MRFSRSGHESAAETNVFFCILKGCLVRLDLSDLRCAGVNSLRMMKETQATRMMGPKIQNTVMPIRSLIVRSDAVKARWRVEYLSQMGRGVKVGIGYQF